MATSGAIRFTESGTIANDLTMALYTKWENSGGFNVDADKTATLTGDIITGNRSSITKLGAGTLQLLPDVDFAPATRRG